MLCQNCGKNEANVRYTQIINGNKKEMILCEECAKNMGISNFKINMPIHFSDFLDNIFDDEELLPDFIQEKSNKCDSCGQLYDEFIKTGLLGCAECYDIFDDKIEPVLKHIQGNVQHVGRKPININEKLQNTGENREKNKQKKLETSSEKNSSKTKTQEISELKSKLDEAIKDERYEDAAIIRDKIKNMMEGK